MIENSRRHYDKVLGALRGRLANEGTSAQVRHRGHTLFDRWLIGSVARQVIAYAHCAVTLVRRIFSRFEKLDVMFTAFINFALIADGLRLC